MPEFSCSFGIFLISTGSSEGVRRFFAMNSSREKGVWVLARRICCTSIGRRSLIVSQWYPWTSWSIESSQMDAIYSRHHPFPLSV